MGRSCCKSYLFLFLIFFLGGIVLGADKVVIDYSDVVGEIAGDE